MTANEKPTKSERFFEILGRLQANTTDRLILFNKESGVVTAFTREEDSPHNSYLVIRQCGMTFLADAMDCDNKEIYFFSKLSVENVVSTQLIGTLECQDYKILEVLRNGEDVTGEWE